MDSKNDPRKKKIAQNITSSMFNIERIKASNFFMSFFDKFRQPKRLRILEEAQVLVDKELDLKKYFDRMRFNLSATMGLLTPSQKLFAKQMSRIVINEDKSDSELNSFGEEE